MQQYIQYLFFEKLNSGHHFEHLDEVCELADRLPWHEEEEFISRTLFSLIS